LTLAWSNAIIGPFPAQLDVEEDVADAEPVSRSEAILAAEAERVRDLLRRYLSPRVADAVLEERHAAHAPAQVFSASILFCDLRGFTAYAERVSPAEVARTLNEFLDQMTQVVFKYDGVLDKYTGDGLIAVFGVPYPQPDHAERAVHAALEMQARHEQLLERRRAEGRPFLPLGIGIESGEVLAGNFGSTQRVDYTVVGHTVNLAARLTGAAPGGQILLGEVTCRMIDSLAEMEPLGAPSLKNVSVPMQAYRLLGLRPQRSAFCLECGERMEGEPVTPPQIAAPCPRCGARRDQTPLSASARDGLMTVARMVSTLTSLQVSQGPHLIAVAGPHQGSDFAVTYPCAIGREALTNQIVLSLDPSVSRRHALLRQHEDGTIIVADLASQNGTHLNDHPVDLAEVRDGDLLTLGRTRLVVSGLRRRDAGPGVSAGRPADVPAGLANRSGTPATKVGGNQVSRQ
jgi:class 3 adenylate cyclase